MIIKTVVIFAIFLLFISSSFESKPGGNTGIPCDHPPGVFVANNKSCDAFYTCHRGYWYEGFCAEPYWFSEKEQSCDYPENVECEFAPSTTAEVTSTTTLSSTEGESTAESTEESTTTVSISTENPGEENSSTSPSESTTSIESTTTEPKTTKSDEGSSSSHSETSTSLESTTPESTTTTKSEEISSSSHSESTTAAEPSTESISSTSSESTSTWESSTSSTQNSTETETSTSEMNTTASHEESTSAVPSPSPPTESTSTLDATTTTTTVRPPTTEAPDLNEFCDEDFVGAIPHPFKCNHYIICFSGIAVDRFCGDDEHFSPIAEKCLPIDQAHCALDGTACPVENDPSNMKVMPNPYNCAGFYICFSQSVIRSYCEKGNHWNQELETCIPEVISKCEAMPPPYKGLENNEVKCPSNQGDQLLPHPREKGKFFLCRNGEPILLDYGAKSETFWLQVVGQALLDKFNKNK